MYYIYVMCLFKYIYLLYALIVIYCFIYYVNFILSIQLGSIHILYICIFQILINVPF